MKIESLRSVAVAATFVTLMLLLGPLTVVRAAGIVVTSTADTTGNGNGCTLREAIINANDNGGTWSDCTAGGGADTITFGVSGTIRLGSALPNITDAAGLTIDGAGKSVTISGDSNGDGTADVPILIVDSGATLVVQNLTIAKGNAGAGTGGGIYNNNGTVAILNSLFTGNHATFGGAISQAGGNLTITNSTFAVNSTNGGAGSGDGGAIYNNGGALTVSNSTFSGNSAIGTNPWGGAIYHAGGPLVVTGSTFSNNSVSSIGGGISINGGTGIVTNSTFAGNTATFGGGGIMTNVPLTITNSTFSGNSAPYGGTIDNASGTAILRNTILANGLIGGNCAGWIQNGGNNIDTGEGCGMNSNGSLSNTDPLLAPLANNGGPTQTMALQPGSPAAGAGNATVCALALPNGPGGIDQRGVPRKPTCDIGAFEIEQVFLPLLVK